MSEKEEKEYGDVLGSVDLNDPVNLDDDIFIYTKLATGDPKDAEEATRRLSGVLSRQKYKQQLRQERVQSFYQDTEQNMLGRAVIGGSRAAIMDLGSVLARVTGDSSTADEMNNIANDLEMAAAERDVDSVSPIISRGLRGVVRSGIESTLMAPAGPVGMIGSAATVRGNQAVTEGKDIGLKGDALASYVAKATSIEGGIAAAFQLAGLGGFESLVGGKQILREGWKAILKETGKQYLSELTEEEITEVLDLWNQVSSGVNTEGMTADNIAQTMLDTFVQTTLMMGPGSAIGAARMRQAQKQAQMLGDMESDPILDQDQGETTQETPTIAPESTIEQQPVSGQEGLEGITTEAISPLQQPMEGVQNVAQQTQEQELPKQESPRDDGIRKEEQGKKEKVKQASIETKKNLESEIIAYAEQNVDLEATKVISEEFEGQYSATPSMSFPGKIPGELADRFDGGTIPVKYRKFLKEDVPGGEAEDYLAEIGSDAFLQELDDMASGKKGQIQSTISAAEQFAKATRDAGMMAKIAHYKKLQELGTREAKRVSEAIVAGDLKTGDTFKINGETHTVIEEHDGAVTIKNGITGEAVDGETLIIDKGTLKSTPKPSPIIESDTPSPRPTEAEARSEVDSGIDYVMNIPETTGKKAASQEVREALNLDTVNSPNRKRMTESLQRAIKRGLPQHAVTRAHELLKKPRALSDEEHAGMVYRMAQLKLEYKRIMRKVKQGATGEELSILAQDAEDVAADFVTIANALLKVSPEVGRALNIRKLMLDEELDILSVKAKAIGKKGGTALTEQESKLFESMVARLESTQKTVEDLQKQIDDLKANYVVKDRKTNRFSRMDKMEISQEKQALSEKLKLLLDSRCAI